MLKVFQQKREQVGQVLLDLLNASFRVTNGAQDKYSGFFHVKTRLTFVVILDSPTLHFCFVKHELLLESLVKVWEQCGKCLIWELSGN